MIRSREAQPAPRRIALVVDRLAPGGKERVVSHLGTEFARAGHRPMVVCMRDRGRFGDQLAAEGIPVAAVGSDRPRDLRGLLRLAGIFRRFAPEVVNVHDRSSLPYAVAANRLAGGAPVILSCHGLLLGPGRRAPLAQRLAARGVRAATAVSRTVAREYRRLLGLGGAVTVIDNGIPIDAPQPDLRREVRDELGADDETFLFLAVGNVKPEKGYDVLLDAIDLLARRGSGRKFSLAVAGAFVDLPCRARLDEQIARLGLQDTVRMLGLRDDASALYSAADALVLPSRTEGLSMALLEAMCMSLPVVASAVGGVPGVLAGAGAGILVASEDPADLARGMGELLTDRPRCKSLGQRGRALVHRRFNAARMARDYLAVYDRAVASTSQPLPPPRHAARKPRAVLLGPERLGAGGMATVMANLRDSSLARRCVLTTIDTGKTTPVGRSPAAGAIAQVRLLGRIVREVAGGRGPIVHLQTCSGFTFWRDSVHMLIARMLGARGVWHVHGAKFGDFVRSPGPLGRAWMNAALSGAGAVIVLGAPWVRELRRASPRARWRVIPNGVPLPAAPAPRETAEPVFLFLGDLGHRKGAGTLVRAAAIAAGRGFTGRVELAGGEVRNGQRRRLEELIEESGCAAGVSLLGVVTGADKAAALQRADAIVLPSRAEGLPMAILEGMAHGLPVIATPVGSVGEAIRDGVEGLLVPPGDCEALAAGMIRLAADGDLRRRMGRAARKRVEGQYSLEAMARRIAGVYDEVLREQR